MEFELSDIPEFHEESVDVKEAAKTAVWDAFFLILFSVVLLMGSGMAFLRYDVR